MINAYNFSDDYISDLHYLYWLIDYYCLGHKDLKKVIKLVQDMTESYHDIN